MPIPIKNTSQHERQASFVTSRLMSRRLRQSSEPRRNRRSVLLNLITVTSSTDKRCVLSTSSDMEGMAQPGDVMFGFIVPLHLDRVYENVSFTTRPPKIPCATFDVDSYQQIQALIFAVEEINNNYNILPNTTLGFQVYDSCNVLQNDLEGALQLMTGSNTAIANYRCLKNILDSAIIGAAVSSNSILLAHVLGLFRYPQISHFATSRLLSDHKKFPSFFRTVPSDLFQSQGLAKLVLYFGWTWVGLVAVDNDYGQQGIQVIKQEIIKAGACIAFTESILSSQADRNARHIVKVIRQSSARVVIIFSTIPDLIPVVQEMLKQKIDGKTFVASEGWSTSPFYATAEVYKIFSGTVGLALYSGVIPGFEDFLSKFHLFNGMGSNWLKMRWEETFSCEFGATKTYGNSSSVMGKVCTGRESLDGTQNGYHDVSNLRIPYNVYTAVYIIAQALSDLEGCRPGAGPFLNAGCAGIRNRKPWQLLYYMKKARITLSNGRELYFDENGNPTAFYDIVNLQVNSEGSIQWLKVGSYDTAATPSAMFTINKSAILWADGENQVFLLVHVSDSFECYKCPWDKWPDHQKTKCLQKNIDYLSYEDHLGLTLAIISTGSSLVPTVILKILAKNKHSAIVKASNYSLSCLLLGSLSLCFLSALIFIGSPNRESCLLRQPTFGLTFVLCISCILAKTIMVLFAFMAVKPLSRLKKWTNIRVAYAITTLCFLLQVILCILWLSLAPPHPQYSTHIYPELIIAECNEGSTFAFWIMLGYLFLLATISFIVAFLARKLPDSFNEAQFITFSMLAFLSVWISYIPASLSAHGKYTVAMEIFAILASSWAIVLCMFFPKCFIILFRPHMNSRETLMGQERRGRQACGPPLLNHTSPHCSTLGG
ncbi:PREDICTED: extracellular calcium-sensing receptor-like [Nanorana parkeri]|uniref:extracellular calcium-sensing receptor-like n=1 Tax=Nanorana parkeri TaxID=125878 RepID=UPI0008543660|nr:PREDICTED: extracellular calcium-sensing receptor-like [Nanorana parkeri]